MRLASLLLSCLITTACGCAHVRPPLAAHPEDRCVHGVACETCIKCHPELAARFKAAHDWCPEHDVPESQCGLCHPEVLRMAPHAPVGADVQRLVAAGEDIGALDDLVVRGKVTIFDFYADWCGPCREIDAHVFARLGPDTGIAYRKLNIVSWDSPLARHHLVGIPNLPYTVVYDRTGARVDAISGLDLSRLDRAILAGAQR